MSQPHFDASHDFSHIQRVQALARQILAAERTANPGVGYDPLVVDLAALLHDVGDRKYRKEGEGDPESEVERRLVEFGADAGLAEKVQLICTKVSYSAETASPDSIAAVRDLCAAVPELAIVQDADRLDALGAVGMARCFTYGGAKGRALGDSAGHFAAKLVKLEALMKTGEGRRLAGERSRRVREFMGWWEEEGGEMEG